MFQQSSMDEETHEHVSPLLSEADRAQEELRKQNHVQEVRMETQVEDVDWMECGNDQDPCGKYFMKCYPPHPGDGSMRHVC